MSVKSEMFYFPTILVIGRGKLQKTVIKQLNQITSSETISNKVPLVQEYISLVTYSKEEDLEKQFSSKYKQRFVKKDKDYLQEISKCCPNGFFLDNWYQCLENVSIAQDTFVNKLVEVRANDKEKYVFVHTKTWQNCPEEHRKEFEVLHIPHGY